MKQVKETKQGTISEIDFYGDSLVFVEGAIMELMTRLDMIRKYYKLRDLRNPMEHSKWRIKTPGSMIEKLKKKGLPVTRESALTKVYDAAGIRIICRFVNDVYEMAYKMSKMQDVEVVEEKDYIKNPKPNGYRSYHMIVKLPVYLGDMSRDIYVEIQIRTIAMDCWASLEHQLKYKQHIPNEHMIAGELKRCADEMASTDLTMQTIQEMIEN